MNLKKLFLVMVVAVNIGASITFYIIFFSAYMQADKTAIVKIDLLGEADIEMVLFAFGLVMFPVYLKMIHYNLFKEKVKKDEEENTAIKKEDKENIARY